MSSPDVREPQSDVSDPEKDERSDGELTPPKKSKKKRLHENDSDLSNPHNKVRKVDNSDEDNGGEDKEDNSAKKDDKEEDKGRRNRKETDKERDKDRGRDNDKSMDRDYDKRRDRDRRRKHYEDYEPPANFERYWGAGPKRSYKERDHRHRGGYDDRSYDHYHDRRDGRVKRRDTSGKVGPRYYGGKDEEPNPSDETKKLDKEDKINASDSAKEVDGNKSVEVISKPVERKVVDMLTSRTGGAYIPPAKLRMMQAQITDKSSAAYQRIAWEALKKSIHGHINKVNTGNLATVIRELLKENLVRGCGLLCRSIIQAQAASPTFTRVFAALVAVVNSRFPQIGELLVKRVVINFKRGFRRQDKASCISSAIFIAHLVNQSVAHELLALEILVLLVETPTSDSVEVAIAFLKEVVDKLLEVAKKGTMAIQDMLRNILHEGTLDKRVQYIIETMFQIIKVGGARKLDDEQKQKEDEELLNLVEEEDQITHIINLDDAVDPQNILDVFKEDLKYEENEAAYKKLLQEILDTDGESGEEGSDEDDDSEEEEDSDDEKKADQIIDNTETNLVALRRTIYLTIQSSLDFEECAHKLMRMQLKPGQEMEMCHMILDCCAEMRTYQKFFGLLAQRFCMINKLYISPFQQIFCDSFATVHRLEINKLRNVAKFFSHLLHTDAISWEVLSTCRLTEEDSTSSSRIFIKILFQELSEYMGLPKLNNRVKDPTLQVAFEGLFPRDDPKNTRFAINFFTSIGLGGLTDELRDHLKSQPRTPVVPLPLQNAVEETTSSSSSSDSSSSSSSSSSSDSSDEEKKKKKKKSKQKLKKGDKSTEQEDNPAATKGKNKPERGRDENFEQLEKRDFDKRSKNNMSKERKNQSEREEKEDGKHQEGRRDKERAEGSFPERREKSFPERGERSFPERGERSFPEKGERSFPERGERRDPERGERRDPERGERRDPDRGDRRDPERGEGRDTAKERKERGFDRGEKRDHRREPQREQRRDEHLEVKKGSTKHQRNEFEGEVQRGGEKEHQREYDRDRGHHENEKPRHGYKDWQKNGDKEGREGKGKERHHR